MNLINDNINRLLSIQSYYYDLDDEERYQYRSTLPHVLAEVINIVSCNKMLKDVFLTEVFDSFSILFCSCWDLFTNPIPINPHSVSSSARWVFSFLIPFDCSIIFFNVWFSPFLKRTLPWWSINSCLNIAPFNTFEWPVNIMIWNNASISYRINCSSITTILLNSRNRSGLVCLKISMYLSFLLLYA